MIALLTRLSAPVPEGKMVYIYLAELDRIASNHLVLVHWYSMIV